MSIRLIDVSGREILPTQQFQAEAGDYTFTLDTQTLPVGVYTFVLQCGLDVHTGLVNVVR